MARPNKGDRTRLTLRIPTDLHEELKEYADYLGKTVNDTVELAVRRALAASRLENHHPQKGRKR